MTTNLVRCAIAASGLLLLAACDRSSEAPAQAPVSGPLPKAVCDQAAKALEPLSKSGAFDHDRKGAATIDEATWIALGNAGQDQFAKALAYDSACAAGSTPHEQQVLVRNEFGRTLTNRTVELVPDIDTLFDQ